MARLLLKLLLVSTLVACGDAKKKDASKRDEAEASSESDKSGAGSLSTVSRRIACESLKAELTIDYYVTRDKLTEKPAAAVEALLERYQKARYTPPGGSQLTSKVKARVVEVKTDSDRNIALAEGVQEQTFSEAQGPNSAVIMHGFHGFVLKHGAEKDIVPWWALHDTDSLEWYLTSRMRELQMRRDNERLRIGFVSQKDELGPDDGDLGLDQSFTLADTFRLYFPIYSIEPVDLKGGDAAVDGALQGLIITQPGKPYTEKELRRIDEFVMRGDKGLLVAAGAANFVRGDSTMTATLDRRGLEKLLGGYGFELGNDVVLDGTLNMQYQAEGQFGEAVLVKLPAILVSTPATPTDPVRLDTSFVPFFRLYDVAFPYPSPIGLKPERQKGAKQRVVMRTSDKAVLDTRSVKSMLPTPSPDLSGIGREQVIAAALEGEIATAFPDGDNMGIVVPAKSPKPSRVLLIASSQFFANPFVVSGRSTTPPHAIDGMFDTTFNPSLKQLANVYTQSNARQIMFAFKNSLDWLSASDGLLELAAKLKPVPRTGPSAAPAASSSASVFDVFKR